MVSDEGCKLDLETLMADSMAACVSWTKRSNRGKTRHLSNAILIQRWFRRVSVGARRFSDLKIKGIKMKKKKKTHPLQQLFTLAGGRNYDAGTCGEIPEPSYIHGSPPRTEYDCESAANCAETTTKKYLFCCFGINLLLAITSQETVSAHYYVCLFY